MSMKTALYANLDAMALQMDCRDDLKLVIEKIDRILSIGKEVSSEIEGQMKLRRIRKGEYKNEIKNSHRR